MDGGGGWQGRDLRPTIERQPPVLLVFQREGQHEDFGVLGQQQKCEMLSVPLCRKKGFRVRPCPGTVPVLVLR
jgi:hypothetical protein